MSPSTRSGSSTHGWRKKIPCNRLWQARTLLNLRYKEGLSVAEVSEAKGIGGGAGGGAKVRPVAVAVFTPDGVRILPIGERKGLIEKLIDRIPEFIDMAKDA